MAPRALLRKVERDGGRDDPEPRRPAAPWRDGARHRRSCRALIGFGLLWAADINAADVLRVPIVVDPPFVQTLVAERVFTGPGGTADVWNDGRGCSFMQLANPAVETRAGQLILTSDGVGRVGQPVGERCVAVLNWRGRVTVVQRPRLVEDRRAIEFDIVDTELARPDGSRGFREGVLWEWLKQGIHPQLRSVTVDFHAAFTQIGDFLAVLDPSTDQATIDQMVDSLRLTGLRTTDAGIESELEFRKPDYEGFTADRSEPLLTEDERAAFEAAWERWDAFLTFVIRQAGERAGAPEVRDALLEVLLDARHTMLAALSEPSAQARDPVRVFFIGTWQRLAPLLRQLANSLPGAHALRYLTFIAATDALEAVDGLTPSTGWELSGDALRRLARILAVDPELDPLRYDTELDQRMRDIFEFGPPPDAPAQPRSQAPAARRLAAAVPAAWADASVSGRGFHRLDGWVPTAAALPTYLDLVRSLLRKTAGAVLTSEAIAHPYHDLYRSLVLATAWQESCWRQYVLRAGKVVPLKSTSGAVGIMQVMPRVWRGFYDPRSLADDIAYNAAAGSEILSYYLVKYALGKAEHTTTGDPLNLARAAYSAYNGGPRQLTRYRRPDAPVAHQNIDAAFWHKFQRVHDGDELAVSECYS